VSALTGLTTNTAPRAYVENLFDGYAKQFDESLVKRLEYRIPKIISDLAQNLHGTGSMGSILDLGCGTGLLGLEIKEYCSNLEGIDLSYQMLEQARKNNVYDNLNHIDIVEHLSESELDFDYFMSTDVFIYVGELSDVFRLIKTRNKRSGRLIFSTEHTELNGFHLEQSGRYSHSKSYIESLCSKFDYSMSHFSTAPLRKDKGQFLEGGLYVLAF
jgi:predicted TPR repeat methyltransferase